MEQNNNPLVNDSRVFMASTIVEIKNAPTNNKEKEVINYSPYIEQYYG